jgi:hypothetical protein
MLASSAGELRPVFLRFGPRMRQEIGDQFLESLSVEPRPFEIRENEKIGDQSTTINPIKYSKFSRRQASLSRSFSCA